MQRDFDRYGRPARGQYTTYQTTYTSSRSRPVDYYGRPMPVGQSVRGPYQPAPYSQNYPLPPPDRPLPQAPPERPSRSVRFVQAGTITPSQSISQVDQQQAARDYRVGQPPFDRGPSSLMRLSDPQFVDRRDVSAYGQRPATIYGQRHATIYRPNYPQVAPVGPEPPAVVNNYNYNTTNIRQTYNIDNSRRELVNARGQRNTHNFLYMTTSSNRRDTIDESRTQQRIVGSSGRLHHRRGHHHHHHREFPGW